MATSTISGTIQDPTGAALSGVTVVARILPRPAFVTATGVELAPLYSTTTNGSGVYALTLTRTADITPAESFYEITEYIPDRYGGPVKHVIQVGSGAASVYASLVSAPPATATDVYLTQASADARYVASPGSFAAVGSITESRPGDAAAAGVLSTYSRGDHKHDREQVSGTTAQIAALTGTDLFTGLVVHDTTTKLVQQYDGSAFRTIGRARAFTPNAQWSRATNLNLPATTETQVTWTTEAVDDFSLTAPTFGQITMPAGTSGLYVVETTFTTSGSLGATGYVQLKRSGDSALARSATIAAGVNHWWTWAVHLTAADVIEIDVYNSTGGAIQLNPGTLKISKLATL